MLLEETLKKQSFKCLAGHFYFFVHFAKLSDMEDCKTPNDSASFGDLISPIIITEGEPEKRPNKKNHHQTKPPNPLNSS